MDGWRVYVMMVWIGASGRRRRRCDAVAPALDCIHTDEATRDWRPMCRSRTCRPFCTTRALSGLGAVVRNCGSCDGDSILMMLTRWTRSEVQFWPRLFLATRVPMRARAADSRRARMIQQRRGLSGNQASGWPACAVSCSSSSNTTPPAPYRLFTEPAGGT